MPEALQSIGHLFNTVLPTVAAYLVISAMLTALPQITGKRQKSQINQAAYPGMKAQTAAPRRAKHYPGAVNTQLNYTIPTSMRVRNTSNY